MTEKQRFLNLIAAEKTPDERVLCKAAFHAILNGEAIDRSGLAAVTGFDPDKVDLLLDGLAGRGLAVVDPANGRIVGCWGLSLIPNDHRLSIRRREIFTWCALDAVGIPAGLGEDAGIVSRCRQCGVTVSVEMVAGQVRRAEPANVRVWVTAGQAGRSVVGFT
jgi:alkylmercury lyase